MKSIYFWSITTSLILVGLFWSAYYGFFQYVWMVDISYLSMLIFIIGMIAIFNIGIMSYQQYNNKLVDARKKLDLLLFTSKNLNRLGIIGTFVGLVYMLINMNVSSFDIDDPQTIVNFMIQLPYSMGTALLTSLVGQVFSFVVFLQTYMLASNEDENQV